jgi:cytochrome c oxidase cbb3-type subunit I/II
MLEKKIEAMRTLGVPYDEEYGEGFSKKAKAHAEAQALDIAKDIIATLPPELTKGMDKEKEAQKLKNKEIIGLIAYLQRLGKDVRVDAQEMAKAETEK